jgi:DNA polymerase-1
MISQHTAFVALPKSLAFQSSMYSPHYVYWKDDGKTWSNNQSEDQLWNYNCIDCVRTREVGEAELQVIEQLGLQEVEAFQQKLFWPVLQAMNRGILVDRKRRTQLSIEITEAVQDRQRFINEVLGVELNTRSAKQMCDVFYTVLKQPVNVSRTIKGVPGHVTCDYDALQMIAKREPILRPIIEAISDLRTLEVFLSTFILAKLDVDQRMRCSYNIGGSNSGKSAPYSYRLSSSQNAFGGGANLQNIPSDKSKSMGKAAARGMSFQLPNLRSMYVPDPGYMFFDMDLDRADLQVVVWESDDREMMEALRLGVDIHLLNVYLLDNVDPPPMEELVETHPRYPDHRAPRKNKREFAKVFCHATNYGGGARTVAVNTGRPVHEIDRAQKRWFGARPGIKQWHDRTLHQIHTQRFVENKFGYRWHIFDRLEQALPAALAWVPQSTVGCYINRIWMNIYEQVPEVEVLIQVHDSLAGQFPLARAEHCLKEIARVSQVVIPYEIPLVIPVGIKTSQVSWGDCK